MDNQSNAANFNVLAPVVQDEAMQDDEIVEAGLPTEPSEYNLTNEEEDNILNPKSPFQHSASSSNHTGQAKPNGEALANSLKSLKLKEGRVRLSGAGRKRFKKFLGMGYSREDALLQASRPSVPPNKAPEGNQNATPSEEKDKAGGKRPRSNDSTPPDPTNKKSRNNEEELSLREVVETVSVGFLPLHYPDILLTDLQMGNIQAAIMDAVEANLDDPSFGFKPSFRGSQYRPGWMVLNCSDEDTAKWLFNNAKRLCKVDGVDLVMVRRENFPHSLIITGHLPNSLEAPNDQIKRWIDGQNVGLGARGWRVIGRINNGTMVQITFSVDAASIAALGHLGWHINYRFGRVQLRCRGIRGAEKMKDGKDPSSETHNSIGAQKPRNVASNGTGEPSASTSGSEVPSHSSEK